MEAGLMHTWERLTVESNRMSGHTGIGSSSHKGSRQQSLARISRLLREVLALRLVRCVRAAIVEAARVSSAGCRIIQTSAERAHGPAVLLRERFEPGIIRNLRCNFNGSRERMALHGFRKKRLMLPPHLRRRISRVIGTTTVVIAKVVITIEEATMAEVVGVEAVTTLRIGAEERLVAPISSLTCHAISGV